MLVHEPYVVSDVLSTLGLETWRAFDGLRRTRQEDDTVLAVGKCMEEMYFLRDKSKPLGNTNSHVVKVYEEM